MDVPDLVRQAVGDEEIRAGVNLGDEDAVVFTPTRALVYRGEGLLSDEDVATYGFDFERLAVSEGRRKTKYTMTYVEGERSFTVPGKRTDDVLEKLIEGMLRVGGAIEESESVTGVYRFSEMTLVITEGRLLKHIGEYAWDADFEAFPYDDLTQLAFEEGSVATQVVLGVGNRSERIKAPNAEAGLVRKTLQQAVFDHYEVSSLEELNREIAVEAEEEAGATDATGGLGLDSGIDPLVSDEPEETPADVDRSDSSDADRSDPSDAGAGGPERSTSQSSSAERSTPQQSNSKGSAAGKDAASGSSRGGASRSQSDSSSTSSRDRDTGSRSQSEKAAGSQTSTAKGGQAAATDDEVLEQLSDLTRAVERQNELLHRQQQTVEKLIEELRQGR